MADGRTGPFHRCPECGRRGVYRRARLGVYGAWWCRLCYRWIDPDRLRAANPGAVIEEAEVEQR